MIRDSEDPRKPTKGMKLSEVFGGPSGGFRLFEFNAVESWMGVRTGGDGHGHAFQQAAVIAGDSRAARWPGQIGQV